MTHMPPRRSPRRTVALAAWLALGATPALAGSDGPAFDCARAHAPAERAVCASPRLSRLDGILGRYYAGARRHLPPPQRACLVQDQRAWLARRNACTGEDCLAAAYRARLAELEGLLPGALLDRRLGEEPGNGGPVLLAVLAPLEQAPAAGLVEITIEGVPLEDEGGFLLVDDRFDRQAWERGPELRDAMGPGDDAAEGDDAHAAGIVGSFASAALDPAALAAVQAAAAAARPLRVSGWTRPGDAGTGIPALDHGRCGYIHRLPAP